jgi:hypothetical protein
MPSSDMVVGEEDHQNIKAILVMMELSPERAATKTFTSLGLSATTSMSVPQKGLPESVRFFNDQDTDSYGSQMNAPATARHVFMYLKITRKEKPVHPP